MARAIPQAFEGKQMPDRALMSIFIFKYEAFALGFNNYVVVSVYIKYSSYIMNYNIFRTIIVKTMICVIYEFYRFPKENW